MNKLTPIVLIIISVGIFFLFIDPQIDEIKTLDETIAQNDDIIKLGNQLRDDKEELLGRYTNISQEDKDSLRKILPDTVDNVRLILDINNIADKFGITISNIGIEGDTNSKDANSTKNIIDANSTSVDYGTIKLSFSCSSNYDNLKSFLMELEDSLRLIDIINFDVTPNQATDDSGGDYFGYSITLSTYWLR